MKKIILGALAAVTVTFSSAAADIYITENEQTLTVDCAKDKNVSIQGNESTITLVGTCAAVSIDGNETKLVGSAKSVAINGNENKVTLDRVDALAVNGNNNKVTWNRPLTQKKARVSNLGNGNKVSRAK